MAGVPKREKSCRGDRAGLAACLASCRPSEGVENRHVVSRLTELDVREGEHGVIRSFLAEPSRFEKGVLLVPLFVVSILAPGVASSAKIALLAGGASHGYGAHEYAAGMELLAQDLRSGVPGLEVVVHHGAWPKDASVLSGADAIVLFMDGGSTHPVREYRDDVESHMRRGVGLMAMHYAVEVPKGPDGEAFRRWIGGYYETDWSINPHWRAETSLDRSHPISRGVEPFSVFDEWYFNMRFRDDMESVSSVLTAVPDDAARSGSTAWPREAKEHIVEASGRLETLLWAVEREDGGRGVGFTGGHFHWNWANDDYRRLVLNAIAWVAGLDVPDEGIPTPPRTFDDLAELEPASIPKRLDAWLRFDPEEVRKQFEPGQ